jgi:hypothetical protein
MFYYECGAPLSSISSSETDHASLLQKYIPPEFAKNILSSSTVATTMFLTMEKGNDRIEPIPQR